MSGWLCTPITLAIRDKLVDHIKLECLLCGINMSTKWSWLDDYVLLTCQLGGANMSMHGTDVSAKSFLSYQVHEGLVQKYEESFLIFSKMNNISYKL